MTYLPPDPPIDVVQGAEKLPPERVLGAPRTPVTRWNRRYLMAAAAVLAAIVALGFYIGFRGANPPGPRPQANTVNSDTAAASPNFSGKYFRGYGDPTVQSDLSGPGVAALPPAGATGAPPLGAASATAPPQPVDPVVQQAQAQALAARGAGPFFAQPQAPGPESSQTGGGPLAAPAISPPPGAVAPASAAAEALPANGQTRKSQFLASAKVDDYLANPLLAPASSWEVKAGTVIPAALITAIDSDLPGEVIAQVTEPVYDHITGRTVLIPQGSRLIGQYDSQIAYGQERALIAWNRIIMPNGRSVNIGSMNGADLTGAAGLKDRVDGHFWQLARGVFLSTAISVGAAEAQDASARSSGDLTYNSAATGVATGAQEVGSQITQRDLNRQPTITVRAGWPLRVLVNKDMILAPYP